MTTVRNNVIRVNKTLIAAAITLACSNITFAQDANVVKTISLIKKPISLIKGKKDAVNNDTTSTKNKSDKIDTAYDDIARLLNQLPGVFSVNNLPNDNNPLITHHSAPSNGSLTLLTDNISLSPAPFYLGGIKHITPLFFAEGNSVNSSSINSFPVATTSNITSKAPRIEESGNVKVNFGSNNKRGISVDHGQDNDDFGHRFYAAKQQVDSHREFSNGDQGQFDSNEIFLKIKENKLGNNKNRTQLSLHYKDFTNDESFVGLSDNDAKSSSQKRYDGTKLDNVSGDDLALGINHQTVLFSGETVTTDIYYNTGDISYYQTGRINGNNVANTAQLLSEFEASSSGSLTLEKESLDSTFRTVGLKIDIAQQFDKHNLNIGVQYHRESVEQSTSFDTFNLDEQLILTQQTSDENSEFIDATSKVTALYLTDSWKHGNWSVDSGIKYLKIKDRREFDNAFFNEVSDETTIFNLEIGYKFSPSFSGFVSTTQGAITQFSTESTLPQSNNRLAAGIVYQHDRGFLSLTAFDNEFDNVFTRCDSVETCALITEDKTDVEINAIELSGGLVTYFDNWSLPVTFNLTSRESKYIFNDPDIDTSIALRNNFTFLPKKQFSIKAGAQFDQLYVGTRIQYRGEQGIAFNQFSASSNNNIDAVTLVDIDANYQISKQHLLSLSIENILDEEYTDQTFYSGNMLGRNRFVSLKYQFNF